MYKDGNKCSQIYRAEQCVCTKMVINVVKSTELSSVCVYKDGNKCSQIYRAERCVYKDGNKCSPIYRAELCVCTKMVINVVKSTMDV